MSWLSNLFTVRTFRCEACHAQKVTIALLEEEIELLTRLLDEEKERNTPRRVERVDYRPFEGAIRKSRTPWSVKQAQLETKSAKEAETQERELWKKRAQAVTTDAPAPEQKLANGD